MVELGYVESLSYETVRQTLKKRTQALVTGKLGNSPPSQCRICLLYGRCAGYFKRSYDPKHPVVCFDESNQQLVQEKRVPLPAQPVQAKRYDYEYERNGVCNLFMFSEPLAGWRHVEVTERRTKQDYARQLKSLVDVYYPDPEKLTLIHDNLNTHVPSTLYRLSIAMEKFWSLRLKSLSVLASSDLFNYKLSKVNCPIFDHLWDSSKLDQRVSAFPKFRVLNIQVL